MCAEKQALRKKLLALRAAEPVEIRERRARAIAQTLFTLPQYQSAHTVFCYCSTAEEISTEAILLDALAQGKRVCVPRCAARGIMTAREISTLAQLQPGKFGIREPASSSPVVLPSEIDLCIVPCLCADPDGYRLGNGGGYYDRFLAQSTAYRIALCAADRLLQTPLPREATDIPCDYILTERR